MVRKQHNEKIKELNERMNFTMNFSNHVRSIICSVCVKCNACKANIQLSHNNVIILNFQLDRQVILFKPSSSLYVRFCVTLRILLLDPHRDHLQLLKMLCTVKTE